MWRALPLFLLIACGNKNSTPSPTEDPKTDDGGATDGEDGGTEDGAEDGGTEDGGTEDGGAEDPKKPTPESLYAECQERLEGIPQWQKEGECTSDEDCVAVGCSTEVCTTKVVAEQGPTTTCEAKLCYKVVDVCGCHDGMCTWTLKDELPEMKQPGMPTKPGPKPLPPSRLPPSPPPEGGE